MTNNQYYYANDTDILRLEQHAVIAFTDWTRLYYRPAPVSVTINGIRKVEWRAHMQGDRNYTTKELFDLWCEEECTEEF